MAVFYNVFEKIEHVLKKGVKDGKLPNTEFSLSYDGDDGSSGWSIYAGNLDPKTQILGIDGGTIFVGDCKTAREALDEFYKKLA